MTQKVAPGAVETVSEATYCRTMCQLSAILHSQLFPSAFLEKIGPVVEAISELI